MKLLKKYKKHLHIIIKSTYYIQYEHKIRQESTAIDTSTCQRARLYGADPIPMAG